VSKPEFNGQRGTVTQFLQNGRFAVKLWDTEEQVASKPDNIVRGASENVPIQKSLRGTSNVTSVATVRAK
jgi:hypothetical protein